ncbi:MAG TPA: hypothetical protein VIK28_10380 [Sedimentisphaerales bacterium]
MAQLSTLGIVATLFDFMIEAIVSGLVLASVSGLAFLSYKHHGGYKLLSRPLKWVWLAAFVGFNGYIIGFSDGKYSNGKPMLFSFGWVLAGFAGFWLFIGLLDFLPEITHQDRKNNADKDKPPKPDA